MSWRKTPAAAKIAKVDLSEAEKSLFLRELDVLTRCRHPNIVQFLGYVDQPFVIVMEWLPMGDLKQYWRARLPRVTSTRSASTSCARSPTSTIASPRPSSTAISNQRMSS